MGDIQRFYIVMLPLSRPAPVRLIVVGKKHLPERGQRFWAAVLAVANTVCLHLLAQNGAASQLCEVPRCHVLHTKAFKRLGFVFTPQPPGNWMICNIGYSLRTMA